MSGSTAIYNQPAGWWGELRVGSDIDTRSKSFAIDLAQISDTISSVSAVNITRQDGATMASGDLSVVGTPTINTTTITSPTGTRYPTGTLVTLWLNAGTVGGVYNVEIVVITSGGRTIGRDTLISVNAAVG
jgi:hypothetical protein